MFPEDKEFDYDHNGRLDGFEFGLKLDEEEREIRDAREHPTTYRVPNQIPAWLIVIAYVLMMLFVNLCVDAVNGIVKSSTYNQAKRLVWQGEYEEAEEKFVSLYDVDYRDTRSYITLCWAHRNFDEGATSMSRSALQRVSFRSLTAKQEKQLAAFRDEVEKVFAAAERRKVAEEKISENALDSTPSK